MSPAPATRGTSEKFSGNWVKRELTRRRAPAATPPPARNPGSAATRPAVGAPGPPGVPAMGRGEGSENLRLSSPGLRTPAAARRPRPGCPCPGALSK